MSQYLTLGFGFAEFSDGEILAVQLFGSGVKQYFFLAQLHLVD